MAEQQIIGHQIQRKALRKLLGSGRFPSAVMLSGTAGIGKRLIAKEIAKSLLCEGVGNEQNYGGCGHCPSCHLLTAGNHPDFFQAEGSDKENCDVESLRQLLNRLTLKAYHGKHKVLLINDADCINQQGANTILKAIEEPPSGTYFLLVATNPSRLPSTVLSRCQRWHFDTLSSSEVTELLERNPTFVPNGLTPVEAARFADGSLSSIEQLATNMEIWHEISVALFEIASGDPARALVLAKNLSSDKESLKLKLDLIRLYAREQLLNAVQSEDAGVQLSWSTLLHNAIVAQQLIFDRHLGAGYVLNNLFLSLASPKTTAPASSNARPFLLDEISI